MKPPSRVARAIGLMLVFPLLVALQLALLALDAPRGIIVPVAILAWLGGPVLLVIGGLLFLRKVRWSVLPSTPLGRFSLRLLGGFVGLFVLFVAVLSSGLGPDDPEEFFDNLYLAIPLVLAGACAVAAGALAGFAIAVRRERSLLVVGTFLFGVLAAIFAAAEIGAEVSGAASV